MDSMVAAITAEADTTAVVATTGADITAAQAIHTTGPDMGVRDSLLTEASPIAQALASAVAPRAASPAVVSAAAAAFMVEAGSAAAVAASMAVADMVVVATKASTKRSILRNHRSKRSSSERQRTATLRWRFFAFASRNFAPQRIAETAARVLS